ncbi:MAG: hypothetical protein FWH20_08565, partial [Oscillospiraceae bacterium]|nr:hypothetical protein [Oscillospiraceae bacterium]
MLKFFKKKTPETPQTPASGGSEVEIKTENIDLSKSRPPKRKQEKQQHKVINSLVGNLSNALELEENAGEIDSLLDEKPQPREYSGSNRPARYRFYIIFGLFVFWLALIGTFTVIGTVGNFARDVINQTALKEEFERFIFPVVVTDPPTFTGADNIQSST